MKMKTIQYLIILLCISCNDKGSMIIPENQYESMVEIHQKMGKNFINFTDSDFHKVDYELIARDSMYLIIVGTEIDTFINFAEDVFTSKLPEFMTEDSLAFRELQVRQLSYICKDSVYSNLKLFVFDDFITEGIFGKLKMVLIGEYEKGIVGSFITDDRLNYSDGEINIEFSNLRGYKPQCFSTDSIFKKIRIHQID